jgi:hypothetical protein
LRTNEFDPLAYIESAFLDRSKEEEAKPEAVEETSDDMNVEIPSISSYLNGSRNVTTNGHKTAPKPAAKATVVEEEPAASNQKFRKTLMSAPRPRRSKAPASSAKPKVDPELQSLWEGLPKNMEFLVGFYDDSITANYYRGEFKESRQELIKRLLDPELSLEETSRLLGVCPATVRRYTNRTWLAHHRTVGGQRRFRLSNIVKFVAEHGRFPEE